LIKVNSKREKDTYGKMFNSGHCVTDQMEKEQTTKKKDDLVSFKTVEDQEFD